MSIKDLRLYCGYLSETPEERERQIKGTPFENLASEKFLNSIGFHSDSGKSPFQIAEAVILKMSKKEEDEKEEENPEELEEKQEEQEEQEEQESDTQGGLEVLAGFAKVLNEQAPEGSQEFLIKYTDMRAHEELASGFKESVVELQRISRFPALRGTGESKYRSTERHRGVLRSPDDLIKATSSAVGTAVLSKNYLLHKITSQSMQIREKKYLPKKRLVNLVLDVSGSMEAPDKLADICVIFNKLQELVESGEVEVNIFTYDDEVHLQEFNVASPRVLLSRVEVGGCTKSGECLSQVFTAIIEHPDTERPSGASRVEVLIVTDEDDSVQGFHHPLVDMGLARVHGVAMCPNPFLEGICRKTGGKYAEL